ncbi:MAG: MEDS domain-containing protein [Actinomycetota bacterium]|nr:MEDS domain-containing protein [Actinomycetota bacterium]MDQ6946647.1 MEDS domain-containing protein [Actinomycetota bacterium]
MPIGVEDIRSGAGDHVVQFYQREADLVYTVAANLFDALRAGETAVVIATGAHRDAFERELMSAGIELGEARGDGRYVPLDAASTLFQLRRDGRIDRDRFNSVIGGVLGQAGATGRRMRVYGEMVTLLWEAGQVAAAIELEGRWNDFGRDMPFSLLCAYPSQAVAGSQHSNALREVCALHSTVVHPDARHWEVTRDFGAEFGAPRAARRFVVDQLRSHGYGEDLVNDAALVLTELAVNALVHARSAFTVALSCDRGAVCISVCDSSSVLPRRRDEDLMKQSGRGLGLVSAVSSRWGVKSTAEGKMVWAVLGP